MTRLTIISICLLAFCGSSLAKGYHFEKISPEEGFAFDGIYCIEEDHLGVIWFAGTNGLYNYNTDAFELYTENDTSLYALPSNKVNKIYVDDRNALWVCTSKGICKFNRNSNNFTSLKIDKEALVQPGYNAMDMLQVNDSIYLCIINAQVYKYNIQFNTLSHLYFYNYRRNAKCNTMVKDNNGGIWFGLSDGTIFRSDSTLQSSQLWKGFRRKSITTIRIVNHHIWIGYYDDGVDKVGMNGNLIQHYGKDEKAPFNLLHNNVRKIEEGNNGDIWIGSFGGINIINDKFNFELTETLYNNLPHSAIHEIKRDKNGGMWIGTWAGGLAYYSPYSFQFRHIKKIPFNSELPRITFSSITQDKNGMIYLGSENDGLKKYDPQKDEFTTEKLFTEKGELINIKSLAFDPNNTLWLGTFHNGLWYKKKGENRFRKVQNDFFKKMVIVNDVVPHDDYLWVCVSGQGVAKLDPENQSVEHYYGTLNDKSGMRTKRTRAIIMDDAENLWLATDSGVCIKKPDSPIFKNLGKLDESLNTTVHTFCITSNGEIWAGSKGKGILRLNGSTMTFEKLPYPWNRELNEVFSLVNDQMGNVWIASNQGVQMYNPQNNRIRYFKEGDGVAGRSFSPNAAFCSREGNVFFGGYNGINIIEPNAITRNPIAPKVLLYDLSINNERHTNSGIADLCNKHISAVKELNLHYSQNTLGFKFVANNYVKSFNNRFKYRVKNYQDEWIELGTKNEVSFTKMPPGRYTLEVMGSNNDQVWSEHPLQIDIRISPPFWTSWYAYITYVMLIIVIGFVVVKETLYRIGIRKKMMIERFNHEAEERLFIEKQKFFTNISHELRTPLTLILSPLDYLLSRFKYEAKTAEHLSMIQRNADRLLRLTNEILDLRLIENGKVKFRKTDTDIIGVCKNAFDCFSFAAFEKEINYIFSSRFEKLNIPIDADKMEKIVYNLLSNAFKYTEEKGQVLITIDKSQKTLSDYNSIFYTGKKFEGSALEIKVTNSGRILKPQDIPEMFERFSTQHEVQAAGTGLGLHISQEYIRLHKGNITVTSNQQDGTTFCIQIPLAVDAEQTEKSLVIQNDIRDLAHGNLLDESGSEVKLQSNTVILLVEDNIDLRKYLKSTLEKRFKVLTASNGQQGYEVAQEIVPDLIISDVKMPVLDGISMTKQLKENAKTRLVPVILLTAMADKVDQIHGIKHGADSYLIKPVEVDLLFAHITNLLESRKQVSKHLHENSAGENAHTHTMEEKLSFTEKLENFILDNLLNSQFGVVDLADKFHLSRSSLHRKLKKEAGLSITEFIREVRIKRAVELMKEKKYNLDEIGTFVGFNSHSYFARSFKAKYGKTPKEFYDAIKLGN